MKFISNKENLLHAIQTVQRFVSSRNPLPILSGILLELVDNKLTFLATDLEIGIKCSISVNGIENGSIVLPAYQFSELVRRFPDTPVEVTTIEEDQSALIKYGNSEACLYGFSSDEFPSLPNYEGSSFSIKENLFKDMLKKVLFAVGTNENRPLFTGVLLELKEEGIFLTASDTHRLSMYNSKLNSWKDFKDEMSQVNIIVPGKALSEITRLLGSNENEFKITISENQIFFSLSNPPSEKQTRPEIMVISRLIAGKFPDFSGAIPVNFTAVVEARVEDLIDAVQRASLLLQGSNQVVKLDFCREKILISSQTEAGRIYEETPASLKGEEMSIYYNARYLNDLFKVIEHGEILIYLSSPGSGSIVKIKGNDGFKSLILPVRKKDDI